MAAAGECGEGRFGQHLLARASKLGRKAKRHEQTVRAREALAALCAAGIFSDLHVWRVIKFSIHGMAGIFRICSRACDSIQREHLLNEQACSLPDLHQAGSIDSPSPELLSRGW